MTQHILIPKLEQVLGKQYVISDPRRNRRYRQGWRSGSGQAVAVLLPQDLLSFYRCLQVCVQERAIIIIQAANTGLTEGSTPSGADYDRPVVVINTLAMNALYLLNHGEQVLSFPGTTLFKLEQHLKPLQRAPHSVIGSSCLGASVVGGIANNSGGALIKRGPAYTEMALFAQVNEQGELVLVNHLGIDLGDTPEAMLDNLMQGRFKQDGLTHSALCSDQEYEQRVRAVDEDSPSRYNADPRRLFEASGCAGKLAVFAVRLDTFAMSQQEQCFYIGTNDMAVLQTLRRDILQTFKHLPEVGEYLHKDMFDIAAVYGKDTFLSVQLLGTDRLPRLFALKSRVDSWCKRLPFIADNASDRLMQWLSRPFKQHLPARMLAFRAKYDHHLILKMSDAGIAEASAYLQAFFQQHAGDYFACSSEEGSKATLHRFAAAGAAMRYHSLHQQQLGELLSLDIALPRNAQDWFETLPSDISQHIDKALYYGHFFCHVFHQDYILKKGSDAKYIKQKMLTLLAQRQAKYPAEHNVGHLYAAEPNLREFYQKLDPTNTFNPGIGQSDKHRRQCACQR